MIDDTINDKNTVAGDGKDMIFAGRMAERLVGTDGVEIEVTHVGKSSWKPL